MATRNYRNKVYVCFDATNDMVYYRTLEMWKANKNINFNFYDAHVINNLTGRANENTIKRKLRERLNNTKLMVVLVGEKTKFHHKYVTWEMKIALKQGIPIIAANVNGHNGFDKNQCPVILG